MRKQIYTCDNCKKEMGDKKHFSFSFNRYSGISVPPEKSVASYWSVVGDLQNKFMHFCSVRCLTVYFSKLFKEAKRELPF
jgi:hypothetical protein